MRSQMQKEMRAVLLVRNGVDHDARVLRAARVAERTLGAPALVVGVATAASPAGTAIVEGVHVVRVSAHPPLPHALAGLRGRGSGGSSRRSLAGTPPQLPPAPIRLTAAARVRRALGGVSYAVQALALARRVRPAVVHANDWNTMWTGLAIKLACRARLVYDSHELWADRNGRWEWRPWLLASEALFVRAADAVLTASPGYADALAARYRTTRPTVVRNIPAQAPAASNLTGAHGASTAHCTRRQPDEPLVVYVGGLLPGRGLEQAIEALALVPGLRLRAVGPGAPAYVASLLARAARIGVGERVELAPPVTPAAVTTAALDGASAGLCLIQPVCRSYELTLPNKLFEYAAAGVPVLASDLPVIAAVVRADGLGEVVSPTDPGEIAAGLERLVEPRRWQLAAQRAHAFARANAWSAESRVLAQLYTTAGSA